MSHPFASTAAKPGEGHIHLALLPPQTPRLRTVQYQYPLKLVSPAPLRTADGGEIVHTVYLLTYGGGIVAGDSLQLSIRLDPTTRLILLTQGSTKLFKSPSREVVSRQRVDVDLAPGAALCYLPDPVQPFAQSCFTQTQRYHVQVAAPSRHGDDGGAAGSLCVLDWVSNGRPANGEHWSFDHYASRSEVFLTVAPPPLATDGQTKPRLLLRDSLRLDAAAGPGAVARSMDNLAVYGTLILYGPLFRALGAFFMDEFKCLPRLGARKWDTANDDEGHQQDPDVAHREERQQRETATGVLWSAAAVRGCVVVKFGAPQLESARQWLRTMLVQEGSVEEHFGERALLCLR